jgi:hypothetical protein
MKERGILFSAPMVRALLAGTKTQTRRIVKLAEFGRSDTPGYFWTFRDRQGRMHDIRLTDALVATRCPYGQPGDRLWVRETWGYTRQCDDINGPGDVIAYAAGGEHVYEDAGGKRRLRRTVHGTVMRPNHFCWPPKPWKPSIHMPRWASRITQEITGVRVERLQEISETDAKAEGCAPAWLDVNGERVNHSSAPTYRQGYARLWNDINGPGSWDANPWVWVVKFELVTPPPEGA